MTVSTRSALFVLLLCMLCRAPAFASTVLEMSFGEVVERAQLVFEGRVLGLDSRQLADGSIHTFVRFSIRDVIKGDYSQDEIELRFLGGQVGGRALHVTDMQMPELGESGIYFVESLLQSQVHPLVGWAQGHFLLQTEANGLEVVTSAEHVPIVALEPVSPPSMQLPLSKGVAKGVLLSQGQGLLAALSRPMSVGDFKDSIRTIVAQQP